MGGGGCVKQFDYGVVSEDSRDESLEDPSRRQGGRKDVGCSRAQAGAVVKISYGNKCKWVQKGLVRSYERVARSRSRESPCITSERGTKSLHPGTKGLDGFPEV